VSGCLVLLTIPGGSTAGRRGQVDDESAFLAKVGQRIASYPDYKSWRAAVVSRQTEMDKHWRPQSVTVVTKTVRLADGVYEEEISQALETKKGKTKDVTAELRKEAREDAEKARRRRAETNRTEGGGRRTRASPSRRSSLSARRRGSAMILLSLPAVFRSGRERWSSRPGSKRPSGSRNRIRLRKEMERKRLAAGKESAGGRGSTGKGLSSSTP
jgi:hypothetical protein